MATRKAESEEKTGVSKVQLALGAASLFLFIVGLKRTFQVEEHRAGRAASGEKRESSEARGKSRRTR